MQADYYGLIEQGMKVEIKLGVPMKGQFTGTVTVVDQMIDAASATFGVRVEMPNPGFKVLAGLNCEVHFGL
ncbi:MAG: efflux RND transporter periplasmic adaptor subunit [Candidatus Polarisedimenticolaceae bacterium]|nr:efflux RND transporter periplasmic adaptor subunit [Candidatus Polarisedimenticolaceae bacterium]